MAHESNDTPRAGNQEAHSANADEDWLGEALDDILARCARERIARQAQIEASIEDAIRRRYRDGYVCAIGDNLVFMHDHGPSNDEVGFGARRSRNLEERVWVNWIYQQIERKWLGRKPGPDASRTDLAERLMAILGRSGEAVEIAEYSEANMALLRHYTATGRR